MYPLLHSLRVVECGSFIAAPSCGLHLLQMGADVVRIDPIGGGPDFHRYPRSPANGASLYWEGLNKGKRSVAVDFRTPQGRELVQQLAAVPGEGAGLFVTNFPADGFLSHERLQQWRQDLITVRVMGWPDGEPAMDYSVNAAVGVPAMTGPAALGDEPVNHVLPAWDLVTGAYAAFALLAAERHRGATGAGQEVRLPLSDVAIACLAHTGMVAEVLAQGDRPRLGNEVFGAFGRDFRTADGQRLMVVAITPRQWTGLVAALGLQDAVAGIERSLQLSFAGDEGLRYEHRRLLLPLFEAAIARRTAADLGAAFEAHGATWGPYRTLAEGMAAEPRLVHGNPLFAPVEHPGGGTYPTAGAAATLSGLPRETPSRAPRLGEHTDEVLAQVLGLSSGQIGQLHDRGLVAGPAA